jgi:hypothetical protein
MPKKPKSSKNQLERKTAAIYVSLYKGEPVSLLTEQIRSCLQAKVVQHQPTIEIYGDIEDPKISIDDISLSYPPYELSIVEITPHNGKWSGFRLRASRKDDDTL